ncbi:serine/threonine protein kinase [Bifidobacterium bohemicum]|uniref:non-specific serine/threonine protein kinase n=1 Tax=Bifidobacterium bohemicum DSM 22767 TaxID=1437606 RepID=A0A086ZG44_9BIFI|nr:PASTA domain-containing protein [Bifidobacterium bohemicum]KFI45494.1 kinase domain protein [Bifidobacterium bohemicum DSM 22767]SCB71864.1 serine/threonine protein kinase [Bifidobacterium bohemicum]
MSQPDTVPQSPLIEGRYRLLGKIAEGGMATVYKALDERLDRTVAIKVMHTQLAQGPHRAEFVERFHREARSAAAISNPHIVQVYDTGTANGLDFLVMEYVHGVNLRHEMDTQGTFDVRETVRIVSQTLDGLASAHRAQVVHRDIKPENILLNDRGRVQITDFGLAKAVSEATLSSTGMLLGTAAYLAPEMIENNEATPQGDLYSVGIMAWEMLAGRVPFVSDNPVTLIFKHVHEDVPSITTACSGINPQVAAFIARLTSRSVAGRPDDATMALAELKSLCAGLGAQDWIYRLPSPAKPTRNSSPGRNGAGTPSSSTPAATNVASRPADRFSMSPNAPTAIPTPNDVSTPTGPLHAESTANLTLSNASGQQAATGRTRSFGPRVHANNGSSALHEPTTVINPITASPTVNTNKPAYGNVDRAGSSAATVPAYKSTAMAPQMPPNAIASRPHRHRGLIVACVVGLVLLAGGSASWWYFWGPGSYWSLPKPDDLSCGEDTPCVIKDISWNDYERTLKVTGIPYTTSLKYSDSVAKGDVISTDPATVSSHISKRQSAKLTVTVSRGVRRSTIPQDILDPGTPSGKRPLDALSQAGFTVVEHDKSKDAYSLEHPEGSILSIDPKPGTTMAHNSKVTVILSKGPMPVSMPNLVGRPKDEAVTAFAQAKLKASFTEEFSDTAPRGTVISTSVKPGTQLHWGDSVDAVVSKGPETVTIPDVRGKKSDEAKKELEALGLKVQISSPAGDWFHQVRFQDPAPGQQVRVHDEKGTATVVTITVV